MGSTIDISKGHQNALQDVATLGNLPYEILDIIRKGPSPDFLDALAAGALISSHTLSIFARYENIFADTCARWMLSLQKDGIQKTEVISAFARILPFAPHLSVYLERYLSSGNSKPSINLLSSASEEILGNTPTLELQQLLLALYRLLHINKHAFTKAVSSKKIQRCLRNDDGLVKYLTCQILCIILSASEARLDVMLKKHVPSEDLARGDFDGNPIDYLFLKLWEHKRAQDLAKWRKSVSDTFAENPTYLPSQYLCPYVTQCNGILLPRVNGLPATLSTLIQTSTTQRNFERLALALLQPMPILLHGPSGSGKTSLVNDFAREMGVESSLVTLHLNEQTDAKMLIGMYTSDVQPGTFKWRPGVLTTAVCEGRWVFIEDLDRAPTDVISVVLPLIERGELVIPSRGECIRAASGFRLLASIRTAFNIRGEEMPPALHMLGARLWHRVPVQMPDHEEFRQIIQEKYPILHRYVPDIILVYKRLYSLSHKSSSTFRDRTFSSRPLGPRDLLKWCRRLEATLLAAGCKTGDEPVDDSTIYNMFLEAADCFSASLQSSDSRHAVISCIAEEMRIDSQIRDHYLDAHTPHHAENISQLTLGRVALQKRSSRNKTAKIPKYRRPFARTKHAKRLLEQVAVTVKMAEPVLLVGETGIGKTTVVQELADTLGFGLTVVNLSQQSEISDLLGGYKPVNVRSLAIPLKEEFEHIFATTGISMTRNQRYLEQLGKYVAKGQWNKASKLWHEAPRMFEKILQQVSEKDAAKPRSDQDHPMKKRKTDSRLQDLLKLKPRWQKFSQDLDQFDVQLSGGSKGFAFTFVEGNIVKAARNGDWVLLDEINLASSDTLESIADLLHSGSGTGPSVLLSETGEIDRVRAHPNFRIFGAMNPATDVGKRDLAMGLRSRFSEIYVDAPDKDLDDLLSIIKAYLKGFIDHDDRAAHDVARLYINTKRLAEDKRLVDGANQVPHFSLRTLTRVLTYAIEIAPLYGLRRALYEGFAMGFLTLLDKASEQMLQPLIDHHLLENHGNSKSLLQKAPARPDDGKSYVKFNSKRTNRQYWMLQGPEEPQEQPRYIITPFVERNMLNLVRATSTRRFPVLVQGPTSSGKTSMIEYLAKFSGNKFVRINNHEHTDLQEYLGTYVSGSDGQLRFQEGLLVQALREGHWIVLDELNLAPTDVLEALNRLLDDNRELFIPETQEVVRPHENFMLFATQNPPGLYGGRKTLSRAFRNRFLELHFDDIPEDELEFILEKRSQKVAPSDCKRIVAVYKELSRLRQSSRLFEQKNSFATLRDLFRWALRDADNREQLAANGFMLLGERVRNPAERQAVQEVIETVMKVKIDVNVLYNASLSSDIQVYNQTAKSNGVVWTKAMQRLYVLVSHALKNNEPVLLIGETGSGKTTVFQMLAEATGKQLFIVNAHQNTETGDLIGAQRPVRNRAAVLEQLAGLLREALTKYIDYSEGLPSDIDALLEIYNGLGPNEVARVPAELRSSIVRMQTKSKALFEWCDGSLVQAMKDGQFFLLDEISLADDSVLERLNSVLESQRTLLLAEKGIDGSFVQASEGFQFFATMNPGGEYGKRELSPALRNRFTEIWVPSLSERDDVLMIVDTKLEPAARSFAPAIVDFAQWFGMTYRSNATTSISVRDILAWVTFMNRSDSLEPELAFLHGAAMVYIDTLGANPAALLALTPSSIQEERMRCLNQLQKLASFDVVSAYAQPAALISSESHLSIGHFKLPKLEGSLAEVGFAMEAPTTKLNAMRIMRAMEVKKPILIEGSPGVGKTTLVSALAKASGNPLTRINLSEQTDLMDLFGSDVPVEGAEVGHFAWQDAPFLQAMQNGHWVLLDEMNLASQSVLEGLNACLDHRGEVYISELDQTFKRHPGFAVFAAQNPHHQGGGRKGLPSSFVNRFTVVYADTLKDDDLQLICKQNFPTIGEELMKQMIMFVSKLEHEVTYKRRFASQGGPWEFNLRDILRWLQLLSCTEPLIPAAEPWDLLNFTFRQRFRTMRDRQELDSLFSQIFGSQESSHNLVQQLSLSAYQVGMSYVQREALLQPQQFPAVDTRRFLPELETVMLCVQHNFPCIIVGPPGSGKSTLIQHTAAAVGKTVTIFPLNSDIDTMDLIGGFEQADPQREIAAFVKDLRESIQTQVLEAFPHDVPVEAIELLDLTYDVGMSSRESISKLQTCLLALQKKTGSSALEEYLVRCQHVLDQSTNIEGARFEWIDGALVQALEQGHWLVLDNANLCSSSVLDRLNSLLEPNGTLIINEHSTSNNEPKVVKPHANFRLFLTLDPRYGELSRAMRNRSVEIYLDPALNESQVQESEAIPLSTMDASTQRFQKLIDAYQGPNLDQSLSQDRARVAFDNLTPTDLSVLQRFKTTVHNGLLGDAPEVSSFLTLCDTYSYLDLKENDAGTELRENVVQLYSSLATRMKLDTGFRDAQPIHTVQNSILMRLFEWNFSSEDAFWMGTALETYIDVIYGRQALKTPMHMMKAKRLKPSEMTRLQRSWAREEVKSVANDSTALVVPFLWKNLEAVASFLREKRAANSSWKVQRHVLLRLMHFWRCTLTLSSKKQFEASEFQAHILLGLDTLEKLSTYASPASRDLVATFKLSIESKFDSGFKLRTGCSMELLWPILRPIPISSAQVLSVLEQMERLAERFDAVRWKVSVNIADLVKVVETLGTVYRLILTQSSDATSLIEALNTEMCRLESSIEDAEHSTVPFFWRQFEALRQYTALKTAEGNSSAKVASELQIYADYPTKSLVQRLNATPTSNLLQHVVELTGRLEFFPAQDAVSLSVLEKLRSLDTVDLRSLQLLESELPSLGRYLASSAAVVSHPPHEPESLLLRKLLSQLLTAHGYDTGSDNYELDGMREFLGQNNCSNLAPDVVSHLLASVSIIPSPEEDMLHHERLRLHSMAWINFALGCLLLYVPDRPFDPQLKQSLGREQHLELRKVLQLRLAALQEYEFNTTGQSTNLRCWLLEQDLQELGEPDTGSAHIYRPDVSEVSNLQGELDNVLSLVSKIRDDMGGVYDMVAFQRQSLEMHQRNAGQLVERLSRGFRPYQDLTSPVISLLHCLTFGLSLATLCVAPVPSSEPITDLITRNTIFLGGSPRSHSSPLAINLAISGHPIESLEIMTPHVAVEGLNNLDQPRQREILQTFRNCYETWKTRLAKDRAEAEIRSSFYRYRGSAEDEDEDTREEFEELFPSFQEDETKPNTKSVSQDSTPRDTAITLSRIHEKIFTDSDAPSGAILSCIRKMSNFAGTLQESGKLSVREGRSELYLPGVMLSLHDRMEVINASYFDSASYNFYTDSNLPEVHKLVQLARKIFHRFRDLQAVDEIAHMQPLQDVVTACNQLLQFQYSEPLAKIITKVEQLHGFVYEWQFGGWASRVHGVQNLYDDLTSTIISWRRLELSTWAKLFDMEDKKCDDDARSWWMVAYEVVIAASRDVQTPEEAKNYPRQLLRELEMYMSTAVQGQYAQRLQMLRHFQRHLELEDKLLGQNTIVSRALSNFIDFYARYEDAVQANLKKGRASLEKAVKDVLLLASWKDTNIVALRDSARRSHVKLFKVVRKYRELLGQPVKPILELGIPEGSVPGELFVSQQNPVVFTNHVRAVEVCQQFVPGWAEKSKRLVNVSNTTKLMQEISQPPSAAVDSPKCLESFLTDLVSSMEELRKETPTTLTDDNKALVKHLKSRKRNLFAITLRDLRTMGINYNLGSNILEDQDTLAKVLAASAPLPQSSLIERDGLQHYYHKAADLILRTVGSVRQHSEDLTQAEVTRSVGFLEGLLKVSIKQHNRVSAAINDSELLETEIKKVRALWGAEERAITISKWKEPLDCEKALRWTPTILKAGIELIRVHAKLAQSSVAPWEAKLTEHLKAFERYLQQWTDLPKLPEGIMLNQHEKVFHDFQKEQRTLRDDLSVFSWKQESDLSYLTRQIGDWLELTAKANAPKSRHSRVSNLDSEVTRLSNTILLTIEHLQKALANFPVSSEDKDWLKNSFDCLAKCIDALDSRKITSLIRQTFSALAELGLDDGDLAQAAQAIFGVAMPILEQYQKIYQEKVVQYAQLHRATCKTAYILAKSFKQIATQGFCTPSEASEKEQGQTDKLEGGTGLGDGDGGEDISKDIQEDEDLEELAQEPNEAKDGEMEDEKDAVDMADADMEGEMGEAPEQEEKDEDGSGDEGENDEMDEEAGDVDDLDPNAVDEKMWDGEAGEAEKNQEGDNSKGKAEKDEVAAAKDQNQKNAAGEEAQDEEESGDEEGDAAEESEEVKHEEAEQHDPKADEGEALELPEDMDLDGNKEEDGGDGVDDMDLEDPEEEVGEDTTEPQKDAGEDGSEVDQDEENPDLDNTEMEIDEINSDKEGEEEDTAADAGEQAEDEEEPETKEDDQDALQVRDDEGAADVDNTAPSDVRGGGEDQAEDEANDQNDSSTQAQRESGKEGGAADQKQAAAEEGELGRRSDGQQPQKQNQLEREDIMPQPFKKLGDALEKWHRQQIQNEKATEEPGDEPEPQPMDVSQENTEYQHVQDEEAKADTQALGTATEDQARALDESMAIEDEETEGPDQPAMQGDDDEEEAHDDAMSVDSTPDEASEQANAYQGREGAMIRQSKPQPDHEPQDAEDHAETMDDVEEEIEEVDTQLSTTHLDDPIALTLSRSASDAHALWSQAEARTRDLSLSLTEQLRLILAPTLATKMRGDFRTGKRLNIKRIIPYIASQYKRDKIWMRRSVPSKRSYQILLALDDSKSMGYSGSGTLAFETLVMVSKSLAMLEVGEIGVVGFGETVKVAHEFDVPFTSEAGPKVFEQFGFEQGQTDVTKLIKESIELFRTARQKASNSPADLWQLELIISDGVCNSSEHDNIRRLLREAMEERIMMVFVVVDDVKSKKKGESVMDLKEARFVKNEMTGNSEVRIERYLDSFPFPYYLIVSEVAQLPGVLAQLLRQWFAEVADTA